MAMIEIAHLAKTFGTGPQQVSALQDVSLTVEKGEIFGIIGLSGAGKSTLVRCINLLERPESGRILFDGKNLVTLKPRQLRLERKSRYDPQNGPGARAYNRVRHSARTRQKQ